MSDLLEECLETGELVHGGVGHRRDARLDPGFPRAIPSY